jgi:hypothetical protein
MKAAKNIKSISANLVLIHLKSSQFLLQWQKVGYIIITFFQIDFKHESAAHRIRENFLHFNSRICKEGTYKNSLYLKRRVSKHWKLANK